MPYFISPADDHHLDALLASCAEEPWNIELRLILADWLEEHGDARAELYRLAVTRSDIKPWLRRWGDDWLGLDSPMWLRNKEGRLCIEWDQNSMGRGESLFKEGWVNGLITRGALGLSMVGEAQRLSEVALSSTSDISDDTLHRLRNLPVLRAVDCGDWGALSNHGVNAISKIGTLKSVDLSRCTQLTNAAIQSLSKLEALERLTIEGCPGMSMTALRPLSRIPSLNHLSMASIDWMTDELSTTLASLPGLEHLDISYCPYVTDALVETIASLPNLKSLAVAGTTVLVDWAQCRAAELPRSYLGDTFFRFFLRTLAQQAVDIEYAMENMSAGIRGVTREGLHKIVGMTRLESLDLRFSQQVDDHLLQKLATLPRLRKLDLSFCEQFTGEGIAALADAHGLQALVLMGNDGITDEAVSPLARMRNLKVLVLECHKVTSEAVAQLRTQLPHCDVRHRTNVDLQKVAKK